MQSAARFITKALVMNRVGDAGFMAPVVSLSETAASQSLFSFLVVAAIGLQMISPCFLWYHERA